MRSQAEHKEQVALMQWWAYYSRTVGVHEKLLLAIPNGGAREAKTGAMLKAEGVRKGVPDLLLAVPNDNYAGLWIELKTACGRTSPEQKKMLELFKGQGFEAVVCRGAEEASLMIMSYLAQPRIKWHARLAGQENLEEQNAV